MNRVAGYNKHMVGMQGVEVWIKGLTHKPKPRDDQFNRIIKKLSKLPFTKKHCNLGKHCSQIRLFGNLPNVLSSSW